MRKNSSIFNEKLLKSIYNFYKAKDYSAKPWEMYTPGSKECNEWFRNRYLKFKAYRNFKKTLDLTKKAKGSR